MTAAAVVGKESVQILGVALPVPENDPHLLSRDPVPVLVAHGNDSLHPLDGIVDHGIHDTEIVAAGALLLEKGPGLRD